MPTVADLGITGDISLDILSVHGVQAWPRRQGRIPECWRVVGWTRVRINSSAAPAGSLRTRACVLGSAQDERPGLADLLPEPLSIAVVDDPLQLVLGHLRNRVILPLLTVSNRAHHRPRQQMGSAQRTAVCADASRLEETMVAGAHYPDEAEATEAHAEDE